MPGPAEKVPKNMGIKKASGKWESKRLPENWNQKGFREMGIKKAFGNHMDFFCHLGYKSFFGAPKFDGVPRF